MKKKLLPIIMCGGSGKRLWPLSKKNYPKQFVDINNGESLFSMTLKRAKMFSSYFKNFNVLPTAVITNEEYRFLCLQQNEKIKLNINIVLEPSQKNSAAALSLGSLTIDENDLIMCVLSSDHLITDDNKFLNSIKHLIDNIKDYQIGLVGIKPTSANINYGYIKIPKNRKQVNRVDKFYEKPARGLANKLFSMDNVFWNSGIFVTTKKTWLYSYKKNSPISFNYLNKSWNKRSTDSFFIRPDTKNFSRIENISIDYAVIEKFKLLNLEILMTKFSGKWSDLGLWDEFSKNIQSDNFVSVKSSNNYVKTKDFNVSLLGVKDSIIIQDEGSLLVASKNNLCSLPFLYEEIANSSPEQLLKTNICFRPWGYYEVLNKNKLFLIKKICIKPNSRISLQSHKYRSEHWIVISGTATIQYEDKITTIEKNQSFFISRQKKHRLINSTKKPLLIIEVQTGIILNEDDITRYHDDYDRK